MVEVENQGKRRKYNMTIYLGTDLDSEKLGKYPVDLSKRELVYRGNSFPLEIIPSGPRKGGFALSNMNDASTIRNL